ncbi:MAG: ABC transporter permease [Acidimicrobiales bacterium]
MIAKLIRRNISGKPFRFLLTCAAVTAGVMFTVGIFVFTDGLRETFGTLAGDIEANVDLDVRAKVDFGGDFNRPQVDVGLADTLAQVPGVDAVQPRVLKFNIVPLDGDGDAQQGSGPNIGLNWEDATTRPRLFLKEGTAPSGPDEFVIDATAFDDGNFTLGDAYTVETSVGPREFTLVGTFFFASPDENRLVGAKLVAFDTPPRST